MAEKDIAKLVSEYLAGSGVRELAGRYNLHRHTVRDHLDRQGVTPRLHAHKLTKDQVEEATQLYSSGSSLAQMGSQFRVHPHTIARELRAAGMAIRSRGRN